MHILTPLPESQFTVVFIFLAAVQVLPFCHHQQGDSDNMNKTRQITTKYSLQKELTKIKQDKKNENWYSMKASPLLPTA
jgi:hypothetical protein